MSRIGLRICICRALLFCLAGCVFPQEGIAIERSSIRGMDRYKSDTSGQYVVFDQGVYRLHENGTMLWLDAAQFQDQPESLRRDQATPASNWAMYTKMHVFQFYEFLEGGLNVVHEEGKLFNAGIQYHIDLLNLDQMLGAFQAEQNPYMIKPMTGHRATHFMDRKLSAELGLEIFKGNVHYKGTHIGDLAGALSVNDITHYRGLQATAKMRAELFSTSYFTIEPSIGLGYRWWRRQLDRGLGSPEIWNILYATVGIGSKFFAVENRHFYFETGLRIPIKNWETAHVSANTTTPGVIPGVGRVRNGKRTTSYVGVGYRTHQMNFTLSYDKHHFGQSNTASTRTLQPESVMTLLGVSMEYYFQ